MKKRKGSLGAWLFLTICVAVSAVIAVPPAASALPVASSGCEAGGGQCCICDEGTDGTPGICIQDDWGTATSCTMNKQFEVTCGGAGCNL